MEKIMRKINFVLLISILVNTRLVAQEGGYCAICSREAWAGDSAALNKFMNGCGVIDTVSYDSLRHPAKTNLAYQTITMKLNDGKVVFRDSVYFVADKMPSFNGDDEALIKYLSANTHYPAGEKTTEGTVYVSFIVEKDGSVNHARIVRGIGEKFNSEALQVMNKMPRWEPGSNRGTPVRVQMNIPVRFSIQ
ncbi:MAG: energy transducer TonB [Bacteroidia bacterium]